MNSDNERINNNSNDNGTNNISFNVNERFKRETPQIKLTESEVEGIAHMLLDRLGYETSWKYYCKVARLIPVNTLERLAIKANEKGDHPGRYFTFLTQREIERIFGQSKDEEE
ncbi:MAG TPA: hypothetical protein VII94_02660 [Candidatus Saccharimonadales bacterium]